MLLGERPVKWRGRETRRAPRTFGERIRMSDALARLGSQLGAGVRLYTSRFFSVTRAMPKTTAVKMAIHVNPAQGERV